MPRRYSLPEHEIEICQRLKAFRRAAGLSRLLFSMGTGIDQSTLVRVEHLRSPLLYDVYKAIDARFSINPLWLRTGLAVPQSDCPLDDSSFSERIKPGALFSEVFDHFLRSQVKTEQRAANEHLKKLSRKMEQFTNEIEQMPAEALEAALAESDAFVNKLSEILEHSSNVNRQLKKPRLTVVNAFVKPEDVKAQWPLLKSRLQQATKATGMKSALARFLGVHLASVSQWLTNSKTNAREPGAETALRMLKWVEQREGK